ncbi:MAG TPA: adenylate/guanylate cyclase domain-containing protein [Methylomirabilota bacterium]|nr:adenylate/guanylate cyclase domain-containing protein [Methylomirabilota bacterium]
MTPASSLEDRLMREIFESERTRLLMLAALAAALVAIFPVLVLLFREDSARIFGTRWALQVLGVFVLLAAYELTARHVIGRRLAQGKTLPRPLRFVNALVETSVPSLLIVIAARQVDPLYPLQSGSAFLYGVFIVLSTLRLDFALSVFTGAVAAVEYVLLCAWYVRDSPLAAGTLFALPPFYVAKGVALVFAGFAAGFVANQIRRRVRRVLRAHEERQQIVNAFGQQVSPAIVDELLKQGAAIPSKRTFVCVLFMDIRNFTRQVEKKTPEEFVAYQNAVFGAAIETVDRHRGVINQFLGDGFMATFGAPVATGHDCRNALSAARDLLAAVKTLAESGRIPPTTIGLGLHAGEAVSGNIGSAARQQYSISGNVVILAARIEQLNKVYGSQLLVSAEVLRGAGESEAGAESLGPVQVKGRDEPIEIYRLA